MPMMMLTPFYSTDQIRARVTELASDIENRIPSGEPLHLIAVLSGGFMLLADLARLISRPVTIDFVRLSSYAGTTTSGTVHIVNDLATDIRDRHTLIVEDIVDTGLTLRVLRDHLLLKTPKSLQTVSLLDKPSRRLTDVPVEFVGFTIDDRFIVGYGLDLNEHHRQLPYLAVVEPH